MMGRDVTRLSLENVCDNIPLLSARFCHRSVFDEIGNFDPKFSESSDREFLLRAAMAGLREASLDVMVSELRLHEGSRTIHYRRDGVPPYLAEHIQIADMLSKRGDIDGQTGDSCRIGARAKSCGCSSINAAPGIGGRPRACCWEQG